MVYEFFYKERKYFYEADGYKPLGVTDEDDNDIDDFDIYEAACEDLRNRFSIASDYSIFSE